MTHHLTTVITGRTHQPQQPGGPVRRRPLAGPLHQDQVLESGRRARHLEPPEDVPPAAGDRPHGDQPAPWRAAHRPANRR
jgi:hypothetical protein